MDRPDAPPQAEPSNPLDSDSESGSFLDQLISDWQRERPDVDTSHKGIIYAIYLLERNFRKQAERSLISIGLRFGDYTVLACLRRTGAPYRLQPGTLVELLELTSGAVSQTLQKLEDKKLVKRTRNTNDNRQVSVTLTAKGKSLVDQAFSDLTERENAIMKELSDADREELQDSLWNLIARFRIR